MNFFSGHIKIRQGVHSGNPVFFELKTDERIILPKRLNSDHGFYIELEKPTRSGNFTVVYGVYKEVGYEESKIYLYYIFNLFLCDHKIRT